MSQSLSPTLCPPVSFRSYSPSNGVQGPTHTALSRVFLSTETNTPSMPPYGSCPPLALTHDSPFPVLPNSQLVDSGGAWVSLSRAGRPLRSYSHLQVPPSSGRDFRLEIFPTSSPLPLTAPRAPPFSGTCNRQRTPPPGIPNVWASSPRRGAVSSLSLPAKQPSLRVQP